MWLFRPLGHYVYWVGQETKPESSVVSYTKHLAHQDIKCTAIISHFLCQADNRKHLKLNTAVAIIYRLDHIEDIIVIQIE